MVKRSYFLKMHPKPNHKPMLFILHATILSIYFVSISGDHNNHIISYPALNYLNCSADPFNCGSIRYLTYPFWGGSRIRSCGRRGFELTCHGGIPMLTISSLSYRVNEIDFSTNTLRIAREDLQNNTCPELLRNTTIDHRLFIYPPNSTDQNVTLHFGCTGDRSRLGTLHNNFSCEVNGHEKVNLFKIGDASSVPGPGIRCEDSIFVPVNQSAARSLQRLTSSSIDILQATLAYGFPVQWLQDVVQFSAPLCNYNVYHNCTAPVFHPAPSDTSEEHQGSNATKNPAVVILIVAVSITGLIMVPIISIYFLKRRHSSNNPNHKRDQEVELFLLQNGFPTPKRYKYSEIKKITKSFSDRLGRGGYGSVYKGILPDGNLVAVKVLIEADSNGEEFMNEVASISRTSHVNIISLLGFCYEGKKRALIYEFMPNKSLDKFLGNNSFCLDLGELYKIAVGIAKGLEYLHTGCTTRIVHFDIKPQNILLDEDFCPKISDFGLARLCKKKQSVLSVVGTRGTIGYIAPEVFSRNFGGVSHKSDVYSYGMMVLEMGGARELFESEVIQSSENYFPDKIYEQVILNVTKKSDDFAVVEIQEAEEIRRKMFLVGFWCIQTTPTNRPSISKVVEMLEGSLESIQIPPKPFLFTHIPDEEISSFSANADTTNSVED